MNGIAKVCKFGECAKKFIPNLDEDGLEYDLLKYDIDEQGPVCSDNTLLTIFQNNMNPSVSDSELYPIIEQICLEYAKEMNYKLKENSHKPKNTAEDNVVNKFTIEGETWEEKKLIDTLKRQFKKLYPSRNLDDIEFEYEEGVEYYFNCLADDINYQIMIDSETGKVYWDKYL